MDAAPVIETIHLDINNRPGGIVSFGNLHVGTKDLLKEGGGTEDDGEAEKEDIGMKDVARNILRDMIAEMVQSDNLDDDRGPVKIIQTIHKWTGERIGEEDAYRKYKSSKDSFRRTQSRQQEVGASQYKADQDNLKKAQGKQTAEEEEKEEVGREGRCQESTYMITSTGPPKTPSHSFRCYTSLGPLQRSSAVLSHLAQRGRYDGSPMGGDPALRTHASMEKMPNFGEF